MASDVRWVDRHIEIDPPKRPKKITATRFAAIMGLNKWNSPFQTWCEITGAYRKPFEPTKYTEAGKIIEPKQAAFMRKTYAMTNLITPEDVYGADHFNKTRGDFFPDRPVLGGMWDYLLVDDDGKVETVLEMKTTKRDEDWQDDIPEYYALQAALYAYLLGIEDVIMVMSVLRDPVDYENPDAFEPTIDNTIVRPFNLWERYPRFEDDYVMPALSWWDQHVIKGISPDYDEAVDKEYLIALKTNSLAPDTDIKAILDEAEMLTQRISDAKATYAEDEKRLKKLTALIKEHAVKQFRDGDSRVELTGTHAVWRVSRSESVGVDKDALERDGLLEKYQTVSESYRITTTFKEDK